MHGDDERSIAIILDGIVIEVVRFNERFAALLLSDPTFVDITDKTVVPGWNFRNGKFTKVIDGELKKIDTEDQTESDVPPQGLKY